MGELYHGSSEKGLKRLEPHKSTHGKYLYATRNKELAIIFSARCGDDCTYELYRNSDDEPWTLVERIPEGFNTMFSNSSSIYTLDDKTFADINTGFSELVSTVDVGTLSEEYIENVYDKIKELEGSGIIKIFPYPTKPIGHPEDNSDLIDKQIIQNTRDNKPVTRESFERLILLHPNLMDKVNKRFPEIKTFTEEDLIRLFEDAVIKQTLYPNYEQYLKSIVISISKTYPELTQFFDERLQFLNMPKDKQLEIFFDKLKNQYQIDLRSQYLNDERSFQEIGKEVLKNIRDIQKGTQR